MIGLRLLLTLLLTALAVTLVAEGTRRRKLMPPLLRVQGPDGGGLPFSGGAVLVRQSLAVLVLGTAGMAGLIRILRSNLLDELAKPYVVAARARGMPEWKLVLKYPVRIALNPFVSTMGYLLPLLLSGSIIVSVVLSLPTLGPVLLNAFLGGNMFLGAAIVFWMGVLTVIGTLISDILLFMLDPRIRPES